LVLENKPNPTTTIMSAVYIYYAHTRNEEILLNVEGTRMCIHDMRPPDARSRQSIEQDHLQTSIITSWAAEGTARKRLRVPISVWPGASMNGKGRTMRATRLISRPPLFFYNLLLLGCDTCLLVADAHALLFFLSYFFFITCIFLS
jgi:hypothetical protein